MRKQQSRTSKNSKKMYDDFKEIDEMNIQRKEERRINFKINCKFKNQKQREMYDLIMNNRIVFVRGSAGTGKTLIAMMAALDCIRDEKIPIDKIILTKPVIEIGKSIGSLPGDLSEKTLCYFTHFYDNLIKLVGSEATKYLKESETIKETILNYVRGSTFGSYDNNGKPIGSICIFDETQNTTPTEMKTFISRLGENSKIVILGDQDQIDLKLNRGEKTGLEDAWDKLQDIKGIGFLEFTEDDIVRDPFLIEIMKRYKKS